MNEKKKEPTTVPKAISDAAAKMRPVAESGAAMATGADRNQLIRRPRGENQRIARANAVDAKVPQRGGPLLSVVPGDVVRTRQRINQLRRTLLDGVAGTDRFVAEVDRLVQELKSFSGGEAAAKAENLKLDPIGKAVRDIRAVMDKHFPEESD